MFDLVPTMTVLAILGISNRWWLLAAAIVVVAVLAVVWSSRARVVKLDIKPLPTEHAARYLAEMEACEAAFVDNPQQSAARARGLVEEVMRRQGFPDRIEPEQRLRDLGRHDRVAAQAMKDAYAGLRSNPETEDLRKAVQNYRDTLRRLLRRETAELGPDGVASEATVG